MKIICIGRNYAEHAKELQNEVPTEPVIFMKPDTALLQGNKPFFYPDFSNDIHHEIELVVRINRIGKHIEARFAHRYFNEIAVGIDFTARDVQQQCKAKGLPWEKAKAFDSSAAVGQFIPIDSLKNKDAIRFHLLKNGQLVQQGVSTDMIFNIHQQIAYISQFVTLKIGDLLFTGTPAGVGPVHKEDVLEGYLEDELNFSFRVK